MKSKERRPVILNVGIVVPAGAQTLDIVGPLDVFREASRQSNGAISYSVQMISLGRDKLIRTDGLSIVADTSIYKQDEPIDTLLVAGTPHVGDLSCLGEFYAWLRRRVPKIRRFGSVCTGVFFLGEAGLLSGRRVTTHWEDAHALSMRYPDIIVEPDKIFVKDGALYTSAGVTAGIDMALNLVEDDCGRELAMIVARRLVVFLKRPGGQSQFSPHLRAQLDMKHRTESIQHWILDNLKSDLSVARIAERAGMSERNFIRVFRAQAGITPAEYVEIARVDAACRILEDSDIALQRVVTRCGFGSLDTMRRSFRRRMGVTPHEYHSRFHT